MGKVNVFLYHFSSEVKPNFCGEILFYVGTFAVGKTRGNYFVYSKQIQKIFYPKFCKIIEDSQL